MMPTLLALPALARLGACGSADPDAPDAPPEVAAAQAPEIAAPPPATPVAAPEPAASAPAPEAAARSLGPLPGSAAGRGSTDLLDIVRGPGAYRDQRVTVQARVGAVLGASAFVLAAHPKDPEGSGNELLVISRSPVPGGPVDMRWLEDVITATGLVGTWSPEELERELGQDLDPSMEFEVEHVNAVLIADEITRQQR